MDRAGLAQGTRCAPYLALPAGSPCAPGLACAHVTMYLLWPLQIQSLGPPAPALALFPRLLSLLHASSSRKPSLKDPGLREPLCCRKIPPLGSFRPDHLSGSTWQPGAHSSQPLPGGRVTAIPMSQGTKAQQAGPSSLLSPRSGVKVPCGVWRGLRRARLGWVRGLHSPGCESGWSLKAPARALGWQEWVEAEEVGPEGSTRPRWTWEAGCGRQPVALQASQSSSLEQHRGPSLSEWGGGPRQMPCPPAEDLETILSAVCFNLQLHTPDPTASRALSHPLQPL